MDALQQLALQLLESKEKRAERINGLYKLADYDDLANAIIADMINLLEQLYLVLNMPQDGFVSMTPERTSGQQED